MLGIGLSVIFAGLLFCLHGVAWAAGEQQDALAAMISAILLGFCLIFQKSRRTLLDLSVDHGWLLLGLGLGGAALGVYLGRAPLSMSLPHAALLMPLVAVAAGYGLARLLGRRPLMLAVAGSGAGAAAWAILTNLPLGGWDAPFTRLTMSLQDQTGAAAAVFAVSFVAATFHLAEQAFLGRAFGGGRLAPRLGPAAILASCCLLGIGLTQGAGAAVSACLAVGVLAFSFLVRKAWIAALLAAAACVGAGLLGVALSLANGWEARLPAVTPERGETLGVFLGVLLLSIWRGDQGRRPARGFALSLAVLALACGLQLFGEGIMSPSGLLGMALLQGGALAFVDSAQRSRRAHRNSAWAPRVEVLNP